MLSLSLSVGAGFPAVPFVAGPPPNFIIEQITMIFPSTMIPE